MIIRIATCLTLLTIGHSLIAQTRPEKDEAVVVKERVATSYLSIQANQLVRQILNFGGGNNSVVNPYLLMYSINGKDNGVGFSTAIGVSYAQNRSNDGFTSVVSSVTDVAFRFGFEKKKYISRRWLTSFAFDILTESNKSVTETKSSGFDNSVTNKLSGWGVGPRTTINYQFHDRFLIGTEMSFYMKFKEQKQTTSNTGMPVDAGEKVNTYNFGLPAVLYLTMKF